MCQLLNRKNNIWLRVKKDPPSHKTINKKHIQYTFIINIEFKQQYV